MMRFGRMPLFPMQTSEQLREEGRQINLRRLIADIARQPLPPLEFEYRPWMKEMAGEKEEAAEVDSEAQAERLGSSPEASG